MTTTAAHTDAAFRAISTGARDPKEVARDARRDHGVRMTADQAAAALDALVAANRAVQCYSGGYVPFHPERGDTIWHGNGGRVYGVKCGVAA